MKDADGKWVLKVKSPPVEGKANEEVILFLSERLRIPKSKIIITGGLNNPYKKVLIEGVDGDYAGDILEKESRKRTT